MADSTTGAAPGRTAPPKAARGRGTEGASRLGRWLLTGAAAAAGLVGGAVRAEGPPEVTASVQKIRATQPQHCMAEGQWHDPLGASPLNLFDGAINRAWVLCPEAAATPDYALDITFSSPVPLDKVRVHLGDAAANHPSRVELGLHNRSLSAAFPVWFHTLNFTGEPHLDLSLVARMPWNPQLLNDVGFVERRRAAGLNQYDVPVPLAVDRITVVLRAVDASKGPVSLGEIELYLGNRKVPVADLPAARNRHAEHLNKGLVRALSDRVLTSADRTVHLQTDGTIRSVPTAAAPDGAATTPSQDLGRWRVVGGRFEVVATAPEGPEAQRRLRAQTEKARKKAVEQGPPVTEDGFTVVNLRIDDAPQVVLLDGPFAGRYTSTAAQGQAASAAPASAPASTTASQPAAAKPPVAAKPPAARTGADDLPFAADEDDEGEIPIP